MVYLTSTSTSHGKKEQHKASSLVHNLDKICAKVYHILQQTQDKYNILHDWKEVPPKYWFGDIELTTRVQNQTES